jgi:hypothetical protein
MPSRIRTTHVLTLKTYSSTIVTGSAAALMVPLTQPPLACKLKFTCVGTPCLGSVIVTGTLLGVAVTETVAFTVATSKNSTKLWDAITSIATTGLTGAVTLTVTAIDALSQPIRWLEDSVDYPCVFNTLGGLNAMLVAQQIGLTGKQIFYMRTNAPITKDSEITVNGLDYVLASGVSIVTIPGTQVQTDREFYAIKKG